MARSRLAPLAVALLCIAALGVAASTMESTLATDPDDEINPDWDRLPIGQDQAATIEDEMNAGDEDGDAAAERGDEKAAEARERHESADQGEPREDAGESGDRDGEPNEAAGGDGDDATGEAERDSGGGVGEGFDHGGIPTLLGLILSFLVTLLKWLLLLALLVASAALAYRYRDRFLAALDRSPRAEEGEADAPQPADEEWPMTDPSSAVDRAWLELVRLVDPERPAVMTPREFAAAARESGLDATAVDVITAAFERTHYGGVPAEEEEPRATDALDRLRNQVGQGGPGAPERTDGGEPGP